MIFCILLETFKIVVKHFNDVGIGVVKKKAKMKAEKKQMKIKDMDPSPPPAIIGQPQVAAAPGKTVSCIRNFIHRIFSRD